MIDQIRLVGCQSWADTTISLSSNKINVIQAPNNTGKSVLFKILKISVAPKVYTARKRKKLIRNRCTEARAYFSFTDGCMAATVIQQTRVIYLFKETNTWESFVEPPKRMIDELGLLVNEKGTFIANIIDTDQNLLLVDSDAASTTEFINMLCNNATLDDYKEKIEIAKGWSLDNIMPVEWELNKVTQELQNLDYVDVDAMRKDAVEIFQKGFACSESVIYAIKKGFDLDLSDDAIAMSSGFPWGLGDGGCICGALAGATMCIGYFFGRRTPGDEIFLKCQRLTKEFHDAFKEHCGATCCRVLTRGKEKNSPERKAQCISFVDFTVEKLAEIILREL